MDSIGNNIRTARLQKGISQEELALAIGVTKSTISKYELGQREPRSEQLNTIAAALGVRYYDLLPAHTKREYNWGYVEGYNNEKIYQFTPCEAQLVMKFNKLNADGRQKAIERIEELTEIPKYQK